MRAPWSDRQNCSHTVSQSLNVSSAFLTIAGDFRTDRAESPELLQKDSILVLEIVAQMANRSRFSIATLDRNALRNS